MKNLVHYLLELKPFATHDLDLERSLWYYWPNWGAFSQRSINSGLNRTRVGVAMLFKSIDRGGIKIINFDDCREGRKDEYIKDSIRGTELIKNGQNLEIAF